jgi:hypothetical protein
MPRQCCFTQVLCGGGGPSASPLLLNDATASIRRRDSHPAHRRSQIIWVKQH